MGVEKTHQLPNARRIVIAALVFAAIALLVVVCCLLEPRGVARHYSMKGVDGYPVDFMRSRPVWDAIGRLTTRRWELPRIRQSTTATSGAFDPTGVPGFSAVNATVGVGAVETVAGHQERMVSLKVRVSGWRSLGLQVPGNAGSTELVIDSDYLFCKDSMNVLLIPTSHEADSSIQLSCAQGSRSARVRVPHDSGTALLYVSLLCPEEKSTMKAVARLLTVQDVEVFESYDDSLPRRWIHTLLQKPRLISSSGQLRCCSVLEVGSDGGISCVAVQVTQAIWSKFTDGVGHVATPWTSFRDGQLTADEQTEAKR